MSQTTIALVILAVTLVLYMIPTVPISVTTLLAMLAMSVTGIISFSDTFAGFANSATLLVAGMMIIGHACFTSGLAEWFGRLLYKFVGSNEKLFVVMIFIIASLLAVFLNGALVVAMIIPIIDSIVQQSNGSISKKQCYFPLGLAATLGNNMTTISATSMITAVGLLTAAGYEEIGLFAPTIINLPAVAIIVIMYGMVGHKLQTKWFDFDEIDIDHTAAEGNSANHSKTKMFITGATMIAVVIGLVAGLNYGACAIAGAVVLIITGCIDEKSAFSSVSWPTIVIVAGAMGLSKGLSASGAGEAIANTLIHICGPLAQSEFSLCVVLFIVGTLLSNVMSDNAAVAIMVPITIALAQQLGYNAVPMVLATASGVKVAVATPLSVATMTMIQSAGYRFKDYLKMGGLVNAVATVIICIAIKAVYYT